MRSASLLLRLFMCLVLAVNGMGLAQAGMHAAGSHAGAVAIDDAATANIARNCHESVATDALPARDPPTDAGDLGCCDEDTCRCQCLVQAPVAFAADPLPALSGMREMRTSTPGARHRPPRLPHLIRPPIG